MISVAQAQDTIREYAQPLAVESVSLNGALDRVLREPISSPGDQPPFDRSAMDGYVIRGDDSSAEWSVVGEIRAGQNIDLKLQPGEAMRIFTGARLPGDKLKVIMQEDVTLLPPSRFRITRPSDELHIRLRGEDARAGEILLKPGMQLNAAAVSLLASVGRTSVLVSCAPRILHLTTGDEIVPPGQPLLPGEIYNSNAFLISALCREWGGHVDHLHASDNLDVMIGLLKRAQPAKYDVILISGGSGAGKYDFAADVFRFLQAAIHFRQVAVRPGKPLIFGSGPAQLVFGLPGNALSHFVCFHLFVRRALCSLTAWDTDVPASAVLAAPIPESGNSRETWWPVRSQLREGCLEASALSWKSSGDITRLPGADALIRVPANTAQLPAGTCVDYLSLRGYV